MSILAHRFLLKNRIELQENQYQIYDIKDINQLLDEYRVSRPSDVRRVCIKNILGYDYKWRNLSNDLYRNFITFFDSEGDIYHSRANGMLEYSPEEMPLKLQNSFKIEPINLVEVESGLYIVDSNGIHRFNILRVCYLSKVQKCKTDEERTQVNDNFTIDVETTKIDIFKSYCNFLLNALVTNFSNRYWLSTDRNNPDLCVVEHSKDKKTLTENELLDYVIENLDANIFGNINFAVLQAKYPSFDKFMSRVLDRIEERKNVL